MFRLIRSAVANDQKVSSIPVAFSESIIFDEIHHSVLFSSGEAESRTVDSDPRFSRSRRTHPNEGVPTSPSCDSASLRKFAEII